MRRWLLAAAGLIAAGAGLWWWLAVPPAEREVRRLFTAVERELNSGTTDGFGSVAHAVRLGEFFAADVIIELGQGSPPIHGRETLIGMATRLQPRTAAFVVELDDVSVELTGGSAADATFTAVIRRRSVLSGDESMDAREFSAQVVNDGGRWRISRLVAIDTLH